VIPKENRLLRIGEVYRYSSSFEKNVPIIDGIPNFIYVTNTEGKNKVLMESGISPIGSAGVCPAILISSSTHKHGSKETPWQDRFEADRGYVRYFGDNKTSKDPSESLGNRTLLEQFSLHNSGMRSERLKAAPILIFRSVLIGSRIKGNRLFEGLALINSAERITQFQSDIGYFTNYVFEFTVLNLAKENDLLNWNWISARRDAQIDAETSLQLAPEAWRNWVKHGDLYDIKLRRQVIKHHSVSKSDQLPTSKSRESNCLNAIYNHYSHHKHGFELLASKVISSHLSRTGSSYLEGWITQGSGDGGVDFVGRLDLGSGFSKVKVIVLGQAKCENPNKPTNGVHISRTVARLKRGWIGAYVTTSFFSEPMQKEIKEDQYPLLMINGLELAREVLILVEKSGNRDVHSFLEELDKKYEGRISARAPEEILID
jgi:hypothetical protein